jgi:hypothetical protein
MWIRFHTAVDLSSPTVTEAHLVADGLFNNTVLSTGLDVFYEHVIWR